jgi:hypothetical protein
MSNILQNVDNKEKLINKLFRKNDMYGIFIRVNLAENDGGYDEIEYYFDGKKNLVPLVWIQHFIDEIIED